MGWLYLALIIVLSTALWPVARWTMAENGDSRVMGFWISLTACAVSFAGLLLRSAPLNGVSLLPGALSFAIAYSIGFIVLMMRALQIGPVGPTVTVNNSAMIFGVLYGVLWLEPHMPDLWVAGGVVGVMLALVMVGCGGESTPAKSETQNGEWLQLVLAGGTLSGLSFMTQTYVGLRHPGIDNSLLFACMGFGLAALILFALVAADMKAVLRRKREMGGGIVLGISNTLGFCLTLLAFREVGAEIVLPVSVTSPMVLVTVLGAAVYGERLKPLTWAGCGLAVLSVGAMAYGNTSSVPLPESTRTMARAPAATMK